MRRPQYKLLLMYCCTAVLLYRFTAAPMHRFRNLEWLEGQLDRWGGAERRAKEEQEAAR